MGFPDGTSGKKQNKTKKKTCLPMQESQKASVQSLGQEDPLEENMEESASVFLSGKCQ